MYPTLRNCRVRGEEGDFYLQNFKTGAEIVLDSMQAQVLHNCDGSLNSQEIAAFHQTTVSELTEFMAGFEQQGLLVMKELSEKLHFGELGHSPYLREVHCDITGRCNLFGICKHCYGRPVFQDLQTEELSLSEVDGLISQMASWNVADCVLSGGEPLLRGDLPEIIGKLDDNAIRLTGIFTNGTVEREDVFEMLKSRQMRTFFFVSLDGARSETNDFMRGPGSFEKTVGFIRRAIFSGFRVVVNTMVIQQNVEELVQMYTFLESLGVSTWRLSTPREQGDAICNSELIMPEWPDVFSAYETLITRAMNGDDRIKIQVGSIFRTDMLQDKALYLFTPASSCCEYKRWSLVVKPNGNIVPCSAFDNLVFGNIREDNIGEVWESDTVQAFKNLPVSKTECASCELLAYCGSGCRKIAYEIHGSIFAKDEQSCPVYEFARDVVVPMLTKHGICPEQLSDETGYTWDEKIIERCLQRC